jgi:hypothetical protein
MTPRTFRFFVIALSSLTPVLARAQASEDESGSASRADQTPTVTDEATPTRGALELDQFYSRRTVGGACVGGVVSDTCLVDYGDLDLAALTLRWPLGQPRWLRRAAEAR